MLRVSASPTPSMEHLLNMKSPSEHQRAQWTFPSWCQWGLALFLATSVWDFCYFLDGSTSYSMRLLQGTQCALISMSPKSSISPRSTFSPPNELLEGLTDWESKSSFNGPPYNYKTKTVLHIKHCHVLTRTEQNSFSNPIPVPRHFN